MIISEIKSFSHSSLDKSNTVYQIFATDKSDCLQMYGYNSRETFVEDINAINAQLDSSKGEYSFRDVLNTVLDHIRQERKQNAWLTEEAEYSLVKVSTMIRDECEENNLDLEGND